MSVALFSGAIRQSSTTWQRRVAAHLVINMTGTAIVHRKNITTPVARPSTSDAKTPVRNNVKKNSKAKVVLDRRSRTGWSTSDEDEIELRRWRGRTDILAVSALEQNEAIFGTFRTQSASGSSYDVEIRSLDTFTNSCGCIDYRVNGFGTCKHIEGVLEVLRRGSPTVLRAAARAGNQRIEVFVDRRGPGTPTLLWPNGRFDGALKMARDWLQPWLEDGERLTADPARIEALLAAQPALPPNVRRVVRISQHFGPWLERSHRQQARVEARAAFEQRLAADPARLDLLKHPLLPYQREGAMHLAFGERALLADDMGLGKTVQAIAACELLTTLKDIHRVLIVCPASLKAEWEEQIARFSERSTRLIFGPRAQRLLAYRHPAFFTIVNYEQVLVDAHDLNHVLSPDVVVLDEAQRIKNWQTKTARRVKALRSPYAFVLTGTPIENRIDELYSIIQYLDPEILGPLFRFNRAFYQLDERGRPIDYQNLAELRQLVQPLMLRRRKADVEAQLPGRTVKNYFVAMAAEQRLRYEDYRLPAARLIAQARKRPLTQAEFERLQLLLACMRMVCDTPAILDPKCRICPKLEELEGILEDLLDDPERKVIIFSEWERMLAMVRELAGELGVEAAWHTGSVPQLRRRAEINRFKRDPACRLFLSTDSGSVGLNLQVASAVINIDLPWNPAKLEQRIARAWRKNQLRSVSVINLVTEDSIEHNMLHLLAQKQALADGLIDGAGDLASLKMPSGRGAFLERMEAVLAASPRAAPRMVDPEEGFALDLVQRHGDKVLLVEARQGADGLPSLLVVLDLNHEAFATERERVPAGMAVEFVDRTTWLAMQRLAATGLLAFTRAPRVLHRSAVLADDAVNAAPDTRAVEAMRQADKALGMAKVLAGGGFQEEAADLLAKALHNVAAALMVGRGELPAGAATVADSDIRRLVEGRSLPAEALAVLDATRSRAAGHDAQDIGSLITVADRVFATVSRNEPALCT